MKKRLLSVLLMCCMVLTPLPTTAFAEESTETPPVCTCETACTTDNMNKECPVCGAENAIPQNCGQYIPVEDRTGENGSTERADDPNGPIELSAADQVQAMIDGLPNAEEITEDNAEEVKAQLEAIDEAKEKLSDEEIDELDMTRYAEAAAALGALVAPMLLANDSPDEQFSLAPGGRYYFDLSAMNIPGTANGDLPDSTLHYVPFTYAGTVDAYKLTSEMATTEEYAQQYKYDHSLFVADYAVTHTVSWDDLNTAGLIFGKDYAAGGVDYTLRAPSVGSGRTYSGESQRGTPLSNEWDKILDKDSGYIKNWSEISSWGQDTKPDNSFPIRANRGDHTARRWNYDGAAGSFPHVGFRPVLEILNADTLDSDGLKVVTLDLNGGKLGGSSDAIHIIVKNGSAFTAPASNGLTRPAGNTGSYFMWLGSDGKLYAPGDSVPADVTNLTAQFALSEQFSLKPGGRYYFDLSAMNIPGTANRDLPDSTLHYVPFTYVGTVDAYKLTSAMATTEEHAQQNKYPHSLFVADYAVTHTISWGGLNDEGLIFGKNYASGGVDYTLRAPSVGSNSTGSGESQHDTPSNNEWDRILDKNSGYIQNWNKMYSWGQDTSSAAESFRAYRGYNSARFWYYTSSSFRNVYLGFRPVLEVLNPGTLGSDGLKVVTLDLGGGKLGGSSEDIQIIVKNGSEFTAPASDGLTRPDGNTGSYFMWLGSNGKLYAPGDNVPADVTKLTAQFALSEQFSLTPGGRYYFDLSAMNIPGTVNGDLPDSTLHYVPFTYVGTVDAYKLTSEMATTEEYAQQNKYPHSLFIADYNVTHTVSRDDLNTKSLIFGKNYASGGVDYILRALSVGSNYTGSGNSERGVPQSNEWDTMLNKDSGYIQNWNEMYSWGQDTVSDDASSRAIRGYTSARGYGWDASSRRGAIYGFRPVLEVLNPDTLGSGGLKAVTLDLGGGKLGGSSDAIHIIVKTGSEFTAPASGGLTRPDGDTGSYFMWLSSDGKLYAPGESVPEVVTTLTAQWTVHQYTITYDLAGGTAEGNPGTYTIETGAFTLKNPTKSGYTFTGWSGTGLTGENNLTVTIPTGSTGNRIYTAHWRYNGGGSGGSSSYPITIPGKTENGSVTVSPKNASAGSTVTITVKPDSGYVLETISVTDKNGNDLKLTDKGNGKYTFTMPGSKVEVKATFMEDNSVLNFFYDVSNDAYYYEAVKWAVENGITGGVGSSLFAPNQPCTRAQIVTFLWRAAGSPVVNYLMPFTDVDEGAYYAEAVRWAASCGIVTGLTETTFGTDSVCTRAQAAAMIYRCAQAQGKGFTGAWMFHLPFTDVPEWAYESVAWCYMNGVTTGVSETSFAPGNDCTRAQIVTFLWRCKK